MRIAPIVLIALFVSPVMAAETSWYEHYEKSLRLIETGKAAAARNELEAAVAAHPREGIQLATRPGEYIDYLPHLYLAVANQMLGKPEEAKSELAKAEDSGLAEHSDVGRPILVAYELLLRGDKAGQYTRPRYAVYAQKSPVLSEAEFEQLRNDVLAKCDVSPDSKMANAPWYAHYELGLELEKKGDYPRALNLFIESVARRPDPQRKARMYGMWLIDYYPYFHIARAHMRLQNWACAKDAFDVSRKLNEIVPGTQEFDEYVTLEGECEKRIAATAK
jgi:tetratricopeptide (TPR) repeat protein